jgi:hypothetical protein
MSLGQSDSADTPLLSNRPIVVVTKNGDGRGIRIALYVGCKDSRREPKLRRAGQRRPLEMDVVTPVPKKVAA